MLDQTCSLPDSTRVAVSSEVTDILRLLKYGDNILGWEGDPNMELMVDFESGMFDVWTLDAHRQPFIVLSRPYCDHRLVLDVLKADTRRRDVAAEVLAHNKAQADREEAALGEAIEERGEKLQWALRRDLGHLDGGTGRLTSMHQGERT